MQAINILKLAYLYCNLLLVVVLDIVLHSYRVQIICGQSCWRKLDVIQL